MLDGHLNTISRREIGALVGAFSVIVKSLFCEGSFEALDGGRHIINSDTYLHPWI